MGGLEGIGRGIEERGHQGMFLHPMGERIFFFFLRRCRTGPQTQEEVT